MKAVKGGYNIKFVPNDENGRYDVFAARKSSSARSYPLIEQSSRAEGSVENVNNDSLPVRFGNHIYPPKHSCLLQSPYPLPPPANPTNVAGDIAQAGSNHSPPGHGFFSWGELLVEPLRLSPSTASIKEGLECIRFEGDLQTSRRQVIPRGPANNQYPRRIARSLYSNRAPKQSFGTPAKFEEGDPKSSTYVTAPSQVAGPKMTWNMMVARADRERDTNRNGANPDRPQLRRVRGVMNLNLLSSDPSSSENPGTAIRHEPREDQDEFDRPIPIKWHKDRANIATPSVHSNGSELDYSSPYFEKSCLTIKKQAYLEAPFPSETVSRWIDTVRSPLDDVDKTTSDNGSAKSTTSSAFWEEVLYSEPVDLWEDVLDNRNHTPPIEYSDNVAAASQGLSRIPLLRQPGYLEQNSFFRVGGLHLGMPFGSRDETELSQEDSTSESSDESSCYVDTFDGILDKVVEASVSQDINKPAETHQSRNDTDTSYLSSSSKTSNDDDATEAAYHAASHARALACLEGRPFKQRTPSPIVRYAHPQAFYNADVTLEKLCYNVRVFHPKPTRAHPTVHFKKLETKVRLGAWMLEAVSETAPGYRTAHQNRPDNPTPRKAKYHNGLFAVDNASMTAYQREIDSWRSLDMESSVAKGGSKVDNYFI